MIPSFHAHIYYDAHSRDLAKAVREQLDREFTVELGRWRDEPVGPHPEPMYQVAFAAEHFAAITQWLMLNRRGLTVFVHPNTGNDLADHRDHPLWMGRMLPLRLDIFHPDDGAEADPDQTSPATQPAPGRRAD